MNKKIVLGVVVLIILVVVVVYGPDWFSNEKRKVEIGLARPYFPYIDYSEKYLNEKFQQIENKDVPTRVTPEETYAKFRQALKDNNLEIAVEQLSKDSQKYDENVGVLTKAYNDGKFTEAFENYPEKIEKQNASDSIATYFYVQDKNGKDIETHIGFEKNKDGDWKLYIF